MSTAERVDDHPIQPRRVAFDWSDTPLHWVPDDPGTSHTINVLHLLLPAGERWFVRVLRHAVPLVDDPVLAAQVKGFSGQEGTHARAHQAVLDHLVTQGLDPTPFTRWMDHLFEVVLSDRDWLPGPLQRLWLRQRLSIVAAIEHFTAVLGQWIVANERLDELGADPEMMALLRWHGAEEVEHRSVAFDLANALNPGLFRRYVAMGVVFPVLLVLWVVGTRFFFRADPILAAEAATTGTRRRPSLRQFLRAGRDGRLPTLRELWGAIPRYLRRDFHPSQEGDLHAARAVLAQVPRP